MLTDKRGLPRIKKILVGLANNIPPIDSQSNSVDDIGRVFEGQTKIWNSEFGRKLHVCQMVRQP